jgi:hypothetical protein
MLTSVGQPVRDLDLWSVEAKLDGWHALVYIEQEPGPAKRASRTQVSPSR